MYKIHKGDYFLYQDECLGKIMNIALYNKEIIVDVKWIYIPNANDWDAALIGQTISYSENFASKFNVLSPAEVDEFKSRIL